MKRFRLLSPHTHVQVMDAQTGRFRGSDRANEFKAAWAVQGPLDSRGRAPASRVESLLRGQSGREAGKGGCNLRTGHQRAVRRVPGTDQGAFRRATAPRQNGSCFRCHCHAMAVASRPALCSPSGSDRLCLGP